MRFFDAAETAQLLDYPGLMASLRGVLVEYDGGEITCPARMVVPCHGGRGMLLSMPCHARDLVAHKLLTAYADNSASGLPAIQGHVSCFRAGDGVPLFGLDGPTVTARRTAAVTMLGLRHLMASPPRRILLIGTGAQAKAHAEAALDLFPDAVIHVRSRSAAAVAAFCGEASGITGRVRPAMPDEAEAAEAVIAVTSSQTPVYDEEPRPGRLVVGVGAYRLDMVEIGARTIAGSQVYVDDIVGAPAEAGDVVAAGSDWADVKTLASALDGSADLSRPVFLKSVGCAAWDLAACRAALASLGPGGPT